MYAFKFSIEKWNSAGKTNKWAKRGLLLEGVNGSFWADVVFTARVKSFAIRV